MSNHGYAKQLPPHPRLTNTDIENEFIIIDKYYTHVSTMVRESDAFSIMELESHLDNAHYNLLQCNK